MNIPGFKKKKTDTISDDTLNQRAATDKTETHRGSSWLTNLRTGRSVSMEFFRANAWLILVIVIATIALIGLRYKTKTKRAEIKQLNTQLQISESEKLREKAEYMSLIRETEMRRLVREKGLPLEFQEQPPYHIVDDR